jgi:D-alanyl-D-alanine carboxypeptidase/D-alanyl-D-alanine-endopeptidase (penicillin-binding protein 4)
VTPRLSRRSRIVAAITGAVVVYLAAAGGAVAFGAAATGKPAAAAPQPRPVASAPTASAPTPTPTPVPRVVPDDPAPAAPVRTCSVEWAATDGRLANFQGRVVNADTGEVLFDRGGETPSRTASVLKVLTGAAALSVLGPDYRLETKVVRGAGTGTVVLVGGGDPTLSRTPSGDSTAYEGAPHLDDLADQVRDAWESDPDTAGTAIERVVVDASYFSGDAWDPSWNRKELFDGYMPEITALMVDGDRDDPYANVSARSEDPLGRAGDAFAAELGASAVEIGTAPEGAQVLGIVESQPVSTLIRQALIVSDNTLAEALARVTAIQAGAGSSFGDLQEGITSGLQAYGIDTSQLTVADGSGLSGNNAVPPSYLTSLFRKVRAGDGDLRVLYDGLPVSGEFGSLGYSDRFAGDNARADGAVHAKTGWIDDGYTLAGIIDAADGTPLTFAIYALGDVSDDAKQAIDTLATAFYDCGDNLSNY